MMAKSVGNPNSDIWLIGDSNPKRWEEYLDSPFDSRHPIRHNIWTSVLEVIQNRVFDELKSQIDTDKIYIRNAIEDSDNKPNRYSDKWNKLVNYELKDFKSKIKESNPRLIITFGAFAYEFVRRSKGRGPIKYSHWTTKRLGNEFRKSINEFNICGTNVFPLLHRSIAGGRFLVSHSHFCNNEAGNYFNYVGNELANVLITNKESLRIWKL